MVRTPKGLAEGAILKAIERYSKEHTGEWFCANDLWPGWTVTQIKSRGIVNDLYGRGYLEERQITCLMAAGGLWMSVNPRIELTEHLEAARAAR